MSKVLERYPKGVIDSRTWPWPINVCLKVYYRSITWNIKGIFMVLTLYFKAVLMVYSRYSMFIVNRTVW